MNRAHIALALILGALPTLPLPTLSAQRTAAPLVVPTSWLADRLRDDNLVILHVGPQNGYNSGHIPGAHPMAQASFAVDRDSLTMEMPDSAAFRSVLEAAGITNNSRIVLYGASNPASLAARLLVTLHHFGLGDRSSLLDGGLPAWRTENREISTQAQVAVPTGSVTLRTRADIVTDRSLVIARLGDSTTAIVDARDTRFYTGAQQNRQMAARPGRVPGARNVVYSSVVSEAGTLLLQPALSSLFSSAGVAPGATVVAYCHIGQQASLVWLAARLAGFTALLYDGSYEDWSKRPELKVDTGGS